MIFTNFKIWTVIIAERVIIKNTLLIFLYNLFMNQDFVNIEILHFIQKNKKKKIKKWKKQKKQNKKNNQKFKKVSKSIIKQMMSMSMQQMIINILKQLVEIFNSSIIINISLTFQFITFSIY